MTSSVFCHDLNVFKVASVATVLVAVQRVMSSMTVVMMIMSMVMLVLVTSSAAAMMTVSFYVTLFGIGQTVANAGRSRSRIDCSTTYWGGGLSSVRR